MHHTHLSRPASQRGLVLALLVHALLLVVVLAQIVFLASRHRVRIDLTSDKMSSTTESTKSDGRWSVGDTAKTASRLQPIAARASRAFARA